LIIKFNLLIPEFKLKGYNGRPNTAA